MNEKHIARIARALTISAKSVENTLELTNTGATVPFIARYRKEATGSLDEVQIADIKEQYERLLKVDKLRENIIFIINDQGKLTDELREKLEGATTITELDDLYMPYKQKRKTRATQAKERGLEPLAKIILEQQIKDIDAACDPFLTGEVTTADAAREGARDIIAEWVNESIEARNKIRWLFDKEAIIESVVVKDKEVEGIKFKDYFDFSEPLYKCPSHRYLALLRGEDESVLRITIFPDEEKAIELLYDLFVKKGNNPCSYQVGIAVKDAYQRLLGPSIETETRNTYKEKADDEAIKVFSENLRQLLLSSPLGQKRVLGIDPGFRTGCKVVCLDAQGNLLENDTIYPHPPQQELSKANRLIGALMEKHAIEAVAIGNGTAGRETEQFIRELLSAKSIEIFMVNESGASIYSASEIAREEFPDHDITVRGAVSIARRLMDPLAELVKIDPKSIGVGQYQHDVDQAKLKSELDQVVESCVNKVGVNINTASKNLLTYVSGLGPQLAQNIVDYRKENGAFKSRKELKKVQRMGEKTFEQCAGFLRIKEAKHPLDNSAVHPESYPIVEAMAKELDCKIDDLMKHAVLRKQINLQKYVTPNVGLPTLTDILQELAKPGLDPRETLKQFEFAHGISKIEHLSTGMVLPGIVTNITNFGAFVDIGVKQDGLVHISQLANKYVSNPNEVVQLQQHVMVKVVEVDIDRKRIQLSMKEVN
jgi:protein Tex